MHGTTMWVAGETRPDTRVAFAGRFTAAGATTVRLLGASWFVAVLDGTELFDGPDRFSHADPSYQELVLDLGPGSHLLEVEVHHHGVGTQHLEPIDPFLWCEVIDGVGGPVSVTWEARRVLDNIPGARRLNPNLAWIEWRDHGAEPGPWEPPVPVHVPGLGPVRAPRAGLVRGLPVATSRVADGTFANRYTTLYDDPPLCVARRRLDPTELPVDGTWFRFDLGAVHLGRPRVLLDVPAGTGVELVYAEALDDDGRVLPWISMSNGPAANLDHYVAAGTGREPFGPGAPRGMRYFEVHVLAPPAQVVLHEASFTERTYFPEPVGTFSCGDELLERIWRTGLRTLRSCAEDAITDCPTRERGQWVGDSAVGMETTAVGWGDQRLVERCLRQAADAAHPEGFVSGNAPGGIAFHLTSFSCIWTTSVWQHFRHTGDRALLAELLPANRANLAGIAAHLTEDGVDRNVPWAFIDWGYVTNEGPSDMALNLLFVAALEAGARWADALGEGDGDGWRATAAQVRGIVRGFLSGRSWEEVGYHVTAWALRLGLVEVHEEVAAVASMKSHLLRCYPNDPDAPRLGTPEMAERRVITPYFSHWAFPPLLDRGETDFVLDQWRTCWGWMLDRGHGTILEVFDERWSQCHQWSAGPTWQLSRYLLGLHPREDLGARTFELRHRPGSVGKASGTFPRADGAVAVTWDAPVLRVESVAPLTIVREDGSLLAEVDGSTVIEPTG